MGNRLRGVPEDEGGIDTEWLEREIKRVDESWKGGEKPFKEPGTSRKLYRHVIYLVATCGNPSGITTGVERRGRLVEVVSFASFGLLSRFSSICYCLSNMGRPGSTTPSSSPTTSTISSNGQRPPLRRTRFIPSHVSLTSIFHLALHPTIPLVNTLAMPSPTAPFLNSAGPASERAGFMVRQILLMDYLRRGAHDRVGRRRSWRRQWWRRL